MDIDNRTGWMFDVPLSQFLYVNVVSMAHVLQQNVAVFKFLRTNLTRKRGTLATIKS